MAKVTLTDISHETGYSLATVSRVINSVGIVKPETREQVIAAAVKLGYAIPAGAEAQPSTTPGDVILVCLPTLGNPFYEDVVAGIRKSAQNHGYNVLIREGSINVKTLPSVLSAISSSCTAGVITMDQISVEVLKSISAKVPVVQCCEYNSLANLPYVSVDDYRIGECAVEHLASIGKKRIALLNGPITCKYAQHRLTGFLDTMRRLNLPEDSSMVINLSDILPDLAFSAALHLMKSGNPPDAFLLPLTSLRLPSFAPLPVQAIGFLRILPLSVLITSVCWHSLLPPSPLLTNRNCSWVPPPANCWLSEFVIQRHQSSRLLSIPN